MEKTGRLILLALALRHDNDWQKIYDDVRNHTEISDDEFLLAENCDLKYVTLLDEEYPCRIKGMTRPPFIIFYEGDIAQLKKIDKKPNKLIFLYGKNLFNIPEENLCVLEDDLKLNIGNKIKIWERLDQSSPFILATKVVQTIVCCNKYSEEKGKRTKFGSLVLSYGLANGDDFYFVPTDVPSFNNSMIKDGANLLSSLDDIECLK